MADKTKIEWTDATWNIITGCTLVDEGCRNCYAAHLITSWPAIGNHPSRKGLARKNAAGEAKFTGEVRFNEQWLDQPLRWRKPRRIFVCAHGDLFHESVPDAWIDRVFVVMSRAPQHTFQVLTKRPERMLAYISQFRAYLHPSSRVLIQASALTKEVASGPPRPDYITMGGVRPEDRPKGSPLFRPDNWPLPNVWLGTSISDQASADARIPALLATPAAVRFVSAEPLLGRVNLAFYLMGQRLADRLAEAMGSGEPHPDRPQSELDWVIVGGESGPNARPMHPDWARSLRDQCVAAGVPFLFKQWGEWAPADLASEEQESEEIRGRWNGVSHRIGKRAAGRLLDGRTWDEMPGVHHD